MQATLLRHFDFALNAGNLLFIVIPDFNQISVAALIVRFTASFVAF